MLTIIHNKPHPIDITSHSRRKEAVRHSRSIALPTKSSIKPLKIKLIGELLTNGYVKICQILPCRTPWVLSAKKLIAKFPANVDSKNPETNKITIAVTPGVKSFDGEGNTIWVCSVVYIIKSLHNLHLYKKQSPLLLIYLIYYIKFRKIIKELILGSFNYVIISESNIRNFFEYSYIPERICI